MAYDSKVEKYCSRRYTLKAFSRISTSDIIPNSFSHTMNLYPSKKSKTLSENQITFKDQQSPDSCRLGNERKLNLSLSAFPKATNLRKRAFARQKQPGGKPLDTPAPFQSDYGRKDSYPLSKFWSFHLQSIF